MGKRLPLDSITCLGLDAVAEGIEPIAVANL